MTMTVRGAAAPTSAGADKAGDAIEVLDDAVAAVAAKADAWAATSASDRAVFLDRIIADTYAEAEAWTAAGCRAKGYDPAST